MGAIVVSVFVLMIGICGTIYFHFEEKKARGNTVGMSLPQQ